MAREHDAAIARYGLSQLLMAVGVRHTFAAEAEPTIYYGTDERLGRAAVIWIQPNESMRGFTPSPPLRIVEGRPLSFDVARATVYWLALESEKVVSSRDEHGRIAGPDSPLGRIDALHSPPVETYARCLTDLLWKYDLVRAFIPRWPQGRKYAVALTHDVDQPERPSAVVSQAWRTLTAAGGGPRRAYWALANEIRTHGLLGAIGFPTRRREWDFDEVCGFEASLGLRSAFYFSAVHRRDGHPLDVQYDLTARRYRTLLSRINEQDWEVGLHAAYDTYRRQPPLDEQLAKMTRLTTARTSGARHHYLMADPHDPIRSLTEHAAAGLLYDTSLGFNGVAGFRCGTALPFQPYHPSTGPIRDFVELPMTIADMHLPTHDTAAAISMVRTHLETVRSLGGLAVLNWHVGHWHSTPAWRDSYVAACRMLAEDSEAWVATPRDIARWWLDRTAALSA